jgi:hypothetical protein
MYHRVSFICGLIIRHRRGISARDVIYNNSQVVATVVNRPSNLSVPHVLFDLTFDFPPIPEWEKKEMFLAVFSTFSCQ